MSKSIYPSIPAPGNDLPSLQATVSALRQSMTMIIMNAQKPNPNFTPSSAAQIFLTKAQLDQTGGAASTGGGVVVSDTPGPKGDPGPAGPPGPPGVGFPDAPNDSTLYARKSLAWSHVLHTDITDWTASLAPYALTASVPVASSTTPVMDGAGAVGTGTTWARADHVHPSDTSRYAASNPAGYITSAALAPYALTSSVPIASTTTPLINGAAAVGSSAAWSRGDHVHPTDTTRYAASNPSGYQTAAQVTASLGAYLPLAGGTITGTLAINGAVTGNTSIVGLGGVYGVSETGCQAAASAGNCDFGWYDFGNTLRGTITYTDSNKTIAWANSTGGGSIQLDGGANTCTLGGATTLVPSQTAGIRGTTTTNNASVGSVGEIIAANVTTGIALTTATNLNVTSISLTPGDWDVNGEIWVSVGTGGATAVHGAIYNVSASIPASSTGSFSRISLPTTFAASTLIVFDLRPCRVLLSATTTYYLIVQVVFPSGTVTVTGNIIARRMR